jgi:serine phosphatase RsbU (regulator of sigma subunit)
MRTVLLSAPPSRPADEPREWLAEAGFAVRDHALGSAPAVELAAPAVAVIEVNDQTEAAAAQTRRWRAELGDEHLPIIWVLPAADAGRATGGLAAGADAVLARPLDRGVFLAQVRSAVRSRESASRVAARAAEARLLGERLNRAFAQSRREHAAARRIRLALLPRELPQVGAARFAVCHHPRAPTGGDFYAVRPVAPDRVVFLLGDVITPGAAGELLGPFVAEAVAEAALATGGVSAGGLLAAANRRLLALGLEDSPLVALLVGVLNATTGNLELARAGMPAPVFVPASGDPEPLALPGPFLGVAETTYVSHAVVLRPGEKLLIGTDGTRPDGEPGPGEAHLLEVVAAHRQLAGQRFVDAAGGELLARVRHEDDFTLLCAEIREGSDVITPGGKP